MKLFVIMIALVVCNCYSWAQGNAAIEKAVKNLQTQGVDTIVRYHTFYGGSMIVPAEKGATTCHAAYKDYLLWVSKYKAYIQRFDDCRAYKPIRINPYFIKVFARHVNTIKAEKILGLQYDTPWLYFFKQTTTIAMAHCGYVTFISYLPSNTFDNTFMDFGLEDKMVGNKYRNKNYEQNHQTIIYKLKILIEKQIAALPWPQ